jgi:uncharacterized membrane protein YbaN (DUF454 family)
MARKHLFQEIREYQVKKKFIIPMLLILGTAGLFLPVLPGIAMIVVAVLLLFPRHGEQFLQKMKRSLSFGQKA